MYESAQTTVMAPGGTSLAPTAVDLTLAMSAQLDDRQEARRRMSPGGKVLLDIGAGSEDGRQSMLRQQPAMSLFSPNSSASGGLSIPGGPDIDHLPPSERYWRERASLMGGRCSVDAHAAKVRERRRVQADLRAWVEDVLDGQQQQQQPEPEFGDFDQQQQPVSCRGKSRWSDLPADLYYQLTGQQLQGAAATAAPLSQQCHHRHHHHQHQRHQRHHGHHHSSSRSSHGRESTRSSQNVSQQAEELLPQQQLQIQIQQQGGPGLHGSTTSSVGASGHLCLTPRTAQESGDELRQQVQAKVDAEVQQQAHLAIQQWDQANPADHQLVLQLRQEQGNLQQQLAEAYEQITVLTQKAGVAAAARSHAGQAPSSGALVKHPANAAATCSTEQLHQQGVPLTHPPDVQMLLARPRDTQQATINCTHGAETQESRRPVTGPDSQKLEAGTRQRAPEVRGAAAACKQQALKVVSPRIAPGPAASSGVKAKAASAARSSRKPWAAEAGASLSQPSMNDCVPDGSSLLGSEQQQALQARLQHAESVMELLQSDLKTSLAAQQQLKLQLQTAQTYLITQQQQQQYLIADGHPDEQRPALSSSSSHEQKSTCELQQLTEQLAAGQQQLKEERDLAASETGQLEQQEHFHETLELCCKQQELLTATRESQVKHLQQHIKQQTVLCSGTVPVMMSTAGTEHEVTGCENQGQTLSSATQMAAVAPADATCPSGPPQQATMAERAEPNRQSSQPRCLQCQQLRAEVLVLHKQLCAQTCGTAIAEHTLAESKQTASPGAGPTRSGSHCQAGTVSCHTEKHKGKGRALVMSTILCPSLPHAASLRASSSAAIAAPQAGDECSESLVQVISTGLASLRSHHLASSICESAAAGYITSVAGLHRMRPLSGRTDSTTEQGLPDYSVKGVSVLTSNFQPPPGPACVSAGQGAALLQLLGQSTPCPGAAAGGASESSNHEASVATSAWQALDDSVVMYHSLQLKGRSNSPKHHVGTARPTTAEPVLASATDSKRLGWMLQAVQSPRRPQTAASIPSPTASAGSHTVPCVSTQHYDSAFTLPTAAAAGGGQGCKMDEFIHLRIGSAAASDKQHCRKVTTVACGRAQQAVAANHHSKTSAGMQRCRQVPRLNLCSVQPGWQLSPTFPTPHSPRPLLP